MYEQNLSEANQVASELWKRKGSAVMFFNNEKQKSIELRYDSYLYNQIQEETNNSDIIITYEGRLIRKDDYPNSKIFEKKDPIFKVYSFEWIVDFLLIEYEKLKNEFNALLQHYRTTATKINTLCIQEKVQELNVQNLQQLGEQQEKNNNQILIQNYETKVSKLKSNRKEYYESDLKPLLSECIFCKQSIQQDQIQLKCAHNYHKECFQDLISAQLLQKILPLQCICHSKISNQTLKLCDKGFAAESLFQIYANELEIIQRTYSKQYSFVICSNKQCGFIWIKEKNISQLGRKCIMCYK